VSDEPTAKKRGRPPATETRARIVEAALALFAARGFEAASVARVAEEAGLSKQALQHHFPTKAELRDAVYEELGASWDALFEQMGPVFTSFEDAAYGRLIDMAVTLFEQRSDVTRFLMRELLDQPEVAGAWLMKHAAPWLDAAGEAQKGMLGRGRGSDRTDAGAHLMITASLLLSMSAMFGGFSDQGEDARLNDARARMRSAVLGFVLQANQLEVESADEDR
jgi:AcrR family transcriptional regulator